MQPTFPIPADAFYATLESYIEKPAVLAFACDLCNCSEAQLRKQLDQHNPLFALKERIKALVRSKLPTRRETIRETLLNHLPVIAHLNTIVSIFYQNTELYQQIINDPTDTVLESALCLLLSQPEHLRSFTQIQMKTSSFHYELNKPNIAVDPITHEIKQHLPSALLEDVFTIKNVSQIVHLIGPTKTNACISYQEIHNTQLPDPENLYWYNDSEHITLFDHPRYSLVLACAADEMTALEDHIELDYAHNLTDLIQLGHTYQKDLIQNRLKIQLTLSKKPFNHLIIYEDDDTDIFPVGHFLVQNQQPIYQTL